MARLSCGVRFTRTVLFLLNIIFLFSGFTLLGWGIYIKIKGDFNAINAAYNLSQILGGEVMQRMGTIMIIAGIVTACLAVFGCLGAICQNRVFLYVYSIIFTLIILLEIAAIIVGLIFRNDLLQFYDSSFAEIFQNAYRNNQTGTIQIIEESECKFKCCGVNSFTDYIKLGYKIPLSCYINEKLNGTPYNQGCAEAVGIWIWNKLPFIAGILSSILFIEILGVISSLVLSVAISRSSDPDVSSKM